MGIALVSLSHHWKCRSQMLWHWAVATTSAAASQLKRVAVSKTLTAPPFDSWLVTHPLDHQPLRTHPLTAHCTTPCHRWRSVQPSVRSSTQQSEKKIIQ